jgi:hypothetical protein
LPTIYELIPKYRSLHMRKNFYCYLKQLPYTPKHYSILIKRSV